MSTRTFLSAARCMPKNRLDISFAIALCNDAASHVHFLASSGGL
jgi:hypothetical protein